MWECIRWAPPAGGRAGSGRRAGMHRMRPLRDDGRAELPGWSCGTVVAALAQAAKYVISNRDAQIADQTADLLTEIGMALAASEGDEATATNHGL